VILSRLAAGVLSIVTRMSKDKSTASDYQTLVSLSDVTRSETIQTFDQLSSRISSSSIHLVRPSSSNQRPKASRKHSSKSSTSNSRSHTRAKSVPSLSVTPLGLATDSGVSQAFSYIIRSENKLITYLVDPSQTFFQKTKFKVQINEFHGLIQEARSPFTGSSSKLRAIIFIISPTISNKLKSPSESSYLASSPTT
jgi:hypothetical protein